MSVSPSVSFCLSICLPICPSVHLHVVFLALLNPIFLCPTCPARPIHGHNHPCMTIHESSHESSSSSPDMVRTAACSSSVTWASTECFWLIDFSPARTFEEPLDNAMPNGGFRAQREMIYVSTCRPQLALAYVSPSCPGRGLRDIVSKCRIAIVLQSEILSPQ